MRVLGAWNDRVCGVCVPVVVLSLPNQLLKWDQPVPDISSKV